MRALAGGPEGGCGHGGRRAGVEPIIGWFSRRFRSWIIPGISPFSQLYPLLTQHLHIDKHAYIHARTHVHPQRDILMQVYTHLNACTSPRPQGRRRGWLPNICLYRLSTQRRQSQGWCAFSPSQLQLVYYSFASLCFSDRMNSNFTELFRREYSWASFAVRNNIE